MLFRVRVRCPDNSFSGRNVKGWVAQPTGNWGVRPRHKQVFAVRHDLEILGVITELPSSRSGRDLLLPSLGHRGHGGSLPFHKVCTCLPNYSYIPKCHNRNKHNATSHSFWTLKNGVFWVVTPCGSCKNRRFGGTWRLLLQGDKNLWTRNNVGC
jgi:hypothetical protein